MAAHKKSSTVPPRVTDPIRDAILEHALPNIAFDGWTWDVALAAAQSAGYDKAMARAVFPGGLPDFVGHLSGWADQHMLGALRGTDPGALRVRDRIRTCILTRLNILAPHDEAVRRAMTYWSVPTRSLMAARLLWRSADAMWLWAGDTATDYNHYTKRALLSGVISSTTLAWLNDDSGESATIEEFVDRRIENVMQFGKLVGRIKKSG